jgi:uncharacterized membrane protein YeaQ/YmgE (transglycosylase-associated protein family)
MEILWFIVIGLVVGALARLLMPGRDPAGIIVTMLLGMAGALVAGVVGRMIGLYGAAEGPGIIAALLGAMLVLGAYRVATRQRIAQPADS